MWSFWYVEMDELGSQIFVQRSPMLRLRVLGPGSRLGGTLDVVLKSHEARPSEHNSLGCLEATRLASYLLLSFLWLLKILLVLHCVFLSSRFVQLAWPWYMIHWCFWPSISKLHGAVTRRGISGCPFNFTGAAWSDVDGNTRHDVPISSSFFNEVHCGTSTSTSCTRHSCSRLNVFVKGLTSPLHSIAWPDCLSTSFDIPRTGYPYK